VFYEPLRKKKEQLVWPDPEEGGGHKRKEDRKKYAPAGETDAGELLKNLRKRELGKKPGETRWSRCFTTDLMKELVLYGKGKKRAGMEESIKFN